MCMEIEAKYLYPTKIPCINELGETESIEVEYEWVPRCCKKCFVFGHGLNKCPQMPKQVKHWVPKGSNQINGGENVVGIEVLKDKQGQEDKEATQEGYQKEK